MSSRDLSPVLLTVLLAGCQQSGVSTHNLVAPSAPSLLAMQTAPVAANAQSVERPNRGHFVFNVDHIQIPPECSPTAPLPFCGGIRSTFGGRCSVPSNFMEFGEGTGEMTHGGRADVSWSHCTRVSAGITFRDGTMTMVTADRDKVTFSYGIGTLSPVSNDLTFIESPFAITGGTGRFDGARGGGTLHGEAAGTPLNLLAGMPFPTDITGTITYAPGRGGQ